MYRECMSRNDWKSILLRTKSHMTSHYTWGPGTLEDLLPQSMVTEVSWDGIGTLSFGLSQSPGHTRGLVTTILGYGSVLGRHWDTFFWALTISRSHLRTHDNKSIVTEVSWDSLWTLLLGFHNLAATLEDPWSQSMVMEVSWDSLWTLLLSSRNFSVTLVDPWPQSMVTEASWDGIGTLFLGLSQSPSHIWGPVTTIHGYGSVLGWPFGCFLSALTISRSHLSTRDHNTWLRKCLGDGPLIGRFLFGSHNLPVQWPQSMGYGSGLGTALWTLSFRLSQSLGHTWGPVTTTHGYGSGLGDGIGTLFFFFWVLATCHGPRLFGSCVKWALRSREFLGSPTAKSLLCSWTCWRTYSH